MEDLYYESVDSYEEPRKKDGRTLGAGALDRPIRTLPLRKPLCLEESRMAREAIELMREHRMGSVLIVRKGRMCGIFTERDVLNQLALCDKNPSELRLSEAMRADPQCLALNAPVAHALNLMSIGGFRHVPLVDDKHRPVGMVSVLDIVNHLVDHFPEKVLNLPPAIGSNFPESREGA